MRFLPTLWLYQREVPIAGQVGLDTTLTWTLLGMSTSQFSVHRGPNRGLRGVVLFVKRTPGFWGDLLWSSCTYWHRIYKILISLIFTDPITPYCLRLRIDEQNERTRCMTIPPIPTFLNLQSLEAQHWGLRPAVRSRSGLCQSCHQVGRSGQGMSRRQGVPRASVTMAAMAGTSWICQACGMNSEVTRGILPGKDKKMYCLLALRFSVLGTKFFNIVQQLLLFAPKILVFRRQLHLLWLCPKQERLHYQ